MKLYRSRQGAFLGVCQGLADWTGYPERYFRLILIIAAFFAHWWAALAYLAGAVLLPLKRPEGYEPEGFKENMEDLRDDARGFLRREYEEFRKAFLKGEKNPSPGDIIG